jgi:hypothetical protein
MSNPQPVAGQSRPRFSYPWHVRCQAVRLSGCQAVRLSVMLTGRIMSCGCLGLSMQIERQSVKACSRKGNMAHSTAAGNVPLIARKVWPWEQESVRRHSPPWSLEIRTDPDPIASFSPVRM